jgi:CTP synthase (UTP-ammonia lyase)
MIRNSMIKILLIGDRSESVLAHQAIPKALELAARPTRSTFDLEWVPTASIHSAADIANKNPRAIWCVPGSPYAHMEGALTAIRFAREENIPFLGTCGGFQHALIEYAGNVLKIRDADHEESNPGATSPIIAKLSCALVEKSETLMLAKDSKLRAIYDFPNATEPYHCSYGINPDFQSRLADSNLTFTAFNSSNHPRAFELKNHPFFIATLFQPERSALANQTHPLITAFVLATSGKTR